MSSVGPSMWQRYRDHRRLRPRLRRRGLWWWKRLYAFFPQAQFGRLNVIPFTALAGVRLRVEARTNAPEPHYAIVAESNSVPSRVASSWTLLPPPRLLNGPLVGFASESEAQEALARLLRALAPSRWRWLWWFLGLSLAWQGLAPTHPVTPPAPAPAFEVPPAAPVAPLAPGHRVGPTGTPAPVTPAAPAGNLPRPDASDPFGLHFQPGSR